MADPSVTELATEREWREAYPVLAELRTDLDEATYRDRLRTMREEGYRLFALREDGDVVALAGVSIGVNFHNGRHAFVSDLVTRADRRSLGYGSRLLGHVEEWAAENGCTRVELTSGRQRTDAHRFYEREGYERPSLVFRKSL